MKRKFTLFILTTFFCNAVLCSTFAGNENKDDLTLELIDIKGNVIQMRNPSIEWKEGPLMRTYSGGLIALIDERKTTIPWEDIMKIEFLGEYDNKRNAHLGRIFFNDGKLEESFIISCVLFGDVGLGLFVINIEKIKQITIKYHVKKRRHI